MGGVSILLSRCFMLRITIESSKYNEKAVGWVMDILKFKIVPYRLTTSKLIKNDSIMFVTVLERK